MTNVCTGRISSLPVRKCISESKQTRILRVSNLPVFGCVHVTPCACGSPLLACIALLSHWCAFLTRLERQAEDKEMLEDGLYSRFVMVLNEKKAKIDQRRHGARPQAGETHGPHEQAVKPRPQALAPPPACSCTCCLKEEMINILYRNSLISNKASSLIT